MPPTDRGQVGRRVRRVTHDPHRSTPTGPPGYPSTAGMNRTTVRVDVPFTRNRGEKNGESPATRGNQVVQTFENDPSHLYGREQPGTSAESGVPRLPPVRTTSRRGTQRRPGRRTGPPKAGPTR